jgi:hypothetical protein
MKRCITIGMCGLLALCGAARAGRLDAAKVSGEAKWVAHMDVEALLASDFGQHILKQIEAGGHAEGIEEFTEKVGFDPTRDLRSITLWGEDYKPDGGVAIIEGKVDKDKLLKLAAENQGHKTAKYGNYVLQSWTQKPQNALDDGVRWGTFYRDDVVIITRDREVLEDAIDTLNDKKATMAGQVAAALVPEASKGAFLSMAASDVPDLPKAGRRGAWLKKVHSAYAELGEADGRMFMNISASAATEKDAQQFRDMLQGMLAFARMGLDRVEENEQPLPLWAPLARAATVGGQGTVVTMVLEMATKDVIELMRSAEEARKARRARHGEKLKSGS